MLSGCDIIRGKVVRKASKGAHQSRWRGTNSHLYHRPSSWPTSRSAYNSTHCLIDQGIAWPDHRTENPIDKHQLKKSDDYNDQTDDSFGGQPIGSREALNTEKCEMPALSKSWETTQPRPQHVTSTCCLQHITDVATAGLGKTHCILF